MPMRAARIARINYYASCAVHVTYAMSCNFLITRRTEPRTCCCDIGTNRRTCVSVPALHKQWFELNRCTGSRTYTSGATGAKCVAGVGCAANATLCAHANGCYHQQWARDFPAATEIVAWFASIR